MHIEKQDNTSLIVISVQFLQILLVETISYHKEHRCGLFNKYVHVSY